MPHDHPLKTCRRCGWQLPHDASAHLVPIHPGRWGVACPGSGTRPLLVRTGAPRAA